MNTLALFFGVMQSTGDLKGLLIQFIIAVVILAIIAGLIWCIERWISPIPAPGKTIIACVLVLLLIFWAISNFL
jgi:hypothetical protein